MSDWTMQGHIIISRFPDGQEVRTSVFKRKSSALSLLYSKDMVWLCKCFKVKARIEQVKLPLWKWVLL